MPNVFEKPVDPIRIDADDFSKVHINIYAADAAAEVPGELRAKVSTPAGAEFITTDVALSSVFDEDELGTLSNFLSALIESAFISHGFEKKTLPDLEPTSKRSLEV
jgi:hypothetical protein